MVRTETLTLGDDEDQVSRWSDYNISIERELSEKRCKVNMIKNFRKLVEGDDFEGEFHNLENCGRMRDGYRRKGRCEDHLCDDQGKEMDL